MLNKPIAINALQNRKFLKGIGQSPGFKLAVTASALAASALTSKLATRRSCYCNDQYGSGFR